MSSGALAFFLSGGAFAFFVYGGALAFLNVWLSPCIFFCLAKPLYFFLSGGALTFFFLVELNYFIEE